MISKVKQFISELSNSLGRFKDVIWFLTLFVILNFLWKIFIQEGGEEEFFIILGHDLTSAVEPICQWTANIVYWIIHDLFGYKTFYIEDTIIYFADSFRLKVVWGCTGIKQIIIFSLLILFYFGPIKKKLIFIPISALILSLINILRIVATSFIVKDGFPDWFIPFNEWYNNRTWVDATTSYKTFIYDWFELFHRDVFRWLYYDGVVFLLWLFWEERINLPYQEMKSKISNK